MLNVSRTAALVLVCGTAANVSAQVGEGFEHGNAGLYTVANGGAVGYVLNAAAAHTGSFGVQYSDANDAFITRLDVPTAPGNRYFARVRSRGTAGGRVYLGVGASAGGAWSAVFAPNTGQLVLQDNAGWNYNELAFAPFVPAVDTWYVLMLTWAANGDMTVSIWNDAMTTQLAATTPFATGFTTPGGISFRGFAVSPAAFNDVDDFGRSNPGACCLPNGTCAVLTSDACLSGNGIYSGDFVSCAAANCAKDYNYTGVSVAIPDGTGNTVCGVEAVAQVTVPDSFPIQNVEANYFISHTFQGDVVVTLEKVGGPSVVLVNRPGVPVGTFGFTNDNYGSAASPPAAHFNSTSFGAVSENFEHGNEGLWGQASAGDNMTINAAGANNGRLGARFDDTLPGFRTRFDYLTSPGNTYVARIRYDGGPGRTYVGVGATANGSFSAVFAPNTGQLILQDNAGWGFVDLQTVAITPVANTWYTLALNWAANGDMTAALWDENMTTQLAITPVATTGYLTPGGFSLRGFVATLGSVYDVDDIGTAVRIYDDPATIGVNNPNGRWRSESSLNPFVGLNAQGNWRLRVKDCAATDTGNLVAFTLLLQAPGAGPACYANCDNSTNPPCLNVNDFVCFNNAYSAGSAYANCDASTNNPILNVNDFVCFNNRYSAGCATPCAPH